MSEDIIGRCLGGRYRITGLINDGGMGTVYQAEDMELFNQPVAVKVLKQSLNGSSDETEEINRKLFIQEAKLSSQLGAHPNIIDIKDYGVENNQLYLVMELLGQSPMEAYSLRELLKKEGYLQSDRVIHLARQMCSALDFAHLRGVLHRDIKPANIMILRDPTLTEVVKILDFGIAKLYRDDSVTLGTSTLGFVGTLSYASPEQMLGHKLDQRSDIYSLGIVLYEMLTGQRPLTPTTETFPGWYQAHVYGKPAGFDTSNLPCSLPQSLKDLVLSCLEKNPDQRPQSMGELSRSLNLISFASNKAELDPSIQAQDSTVIESRLLENQQADTTLEPSPIDALPVKPVPTRFKPPQVAPIYYIISTFLLIGGAIFLGYLYLRMRTEDTPVPLATPSGTPADCVEALMRLGVSREKAIEGCEPVETGL